MYEVETAELATLVAQLKTLVDLLTSQRRTEDPHDFTAYISSTQWWAVDYHNRKHIFIWLPSTALTLSFEEYGQGPVQAQVWTNIAMPAGNRMLAVGQSTLTPVLIRCTDEVIP